MVDNKDGLDTEGLPRPNDNELTPEMQQELLKEIQSSMFTNLNLGGRYAAERKRRKYHRHWSPKAMARKRSARLMAKASRQRTRRFAKSR